MSPVSTRSSAHLADGMQEVKETDEDRRNKEILRNQAHLQVIDHVVQVHRDERRRELRQRLEEIRDELSNMKLNGGDPLALATEDSWTCILNFVVGNTDRLSLSKTCTLFEKILKTLKQQWLFQKIIPLFVGYVQKDDALNCRLVCRAWAQAIDNCWGTTIQVGDDGRKPEELFTGSDRNTKQSLANFFQSPVTYERINALRDVLIRHPRNPFIGGTVHLEVNPPQNSDDYSIIIMHVEKIMKDFGRKIWHFKLFGRDGNYPNILPWIYYPILFRILSDCRNLRTLSLSKINVPWPHERSGSLAALCVSRKLRGKYTPPEHRNLETLKVQKHNVHFIKIWDKLLEAYSSQLKCLEVCLWDPDLYHHFSWDKLTRLQITADNSNSLIGSLKQMEAPNLRELGFRFTKSSQVQFKRFIALVNRLKMLEKIELTFAEDFPGFARNEMLKSSHRGWAYTSSPTVAHLELYIQSVNSAFSLDFLTYFPYLKRLCIQLDPTAFTDGTEDPSAMEYDIIKISNILTAEIEIADRYKCNVWEILSRLESLEIGKSNADGSVQRTELTRNAYDYFRRKA